jgi:hypothetical protein
MSSSSEIEDKLSSFDGDEEEDPTLSTIPTVSSPSMPEGKPSSDEETKDTIEKEEEDDDVEDIPPFEWSTEIADSLTKGKISPVERWDSGFFLTSSKRCVLFFSFHF